MAAAERITFADFQKRFKTEEQCQKYLFRQRFTDGFVCPSCGAKEYCTGEFRVAIQPAIRTRLISKNKQFSLKSRILNPNGENNTLISDTSNSPIKIKTEDS